MAKSKALNHFRVGIIPIEGFALMSYASTVEPFRAANKLSGSDFYNVKTLSLSGGYVESSGDAAVATEKLQSAKDIDLILVVAGGDPVSFADKRLFAFLQKLSRTKTRIGGVSGGPVILVKAGIMAGRRLTVHWEHAEGLLELAPDSLLERRLFVSDRDRLTCAGGTAPLDMAHALISEHHGSVFAQLVSDWFLHTQTRPGRAPQRAGLVTRIGTTHPSVLRAVVSMENNMAEPSSLSELAQQAGVSRRQLVRLFQDKLGRSPMKYYRDLRAERAQNLLQNSSLSVAEIAAATGFANAGHLTKVYKESFGQTPSRNRA